MESDGIFGMDLWTTDHGLDFAAQPESSKGKNVTMDDLLFGQVSENTPQPIVYTTEGLPAAQRQVTENAHGHNLRTNPNIDIDELLNHRPSKQRHLAATWTKLYNDIYSEIMTLKTNVYTVCDPPLAQDTSNTLINAFRRFTEVHQEYIQGIKERKSLETVEMKYSSLKDLLKNILDEVKKQLQISRSSDKNDALESVSVRSDHSRLSSSSSTSSQKQKLRTMLLAKRKLELAKARRLEDIENAKVLQDMNARKEIRKLEEEAALAEVEWQVETECERNDSNEDQDNVQFSTPMESSFRQAKIPPSKISTFDHNSEDHNGNLTSRAPPDNAWSLDACTQNSATPLTPKQVNDIPRASIPDSTHNNDIPRASIPDSTHNNDTPRASIPDSTHNNDTPRPYVHDVTHSDETPRASIPESIRNTNTSRETGSNDVQPHATPLAPAVRYEGNSIALPKQEFQLTQYSSEKSRVSHPFELCDRHPFNTSEPGYHAFFGDSNSNSREHSPTTAVKPDKSMDHIAAMLKIQLLNGIKPTQFSGKPADYNTYIY